MIKNINTNTNISTKDTGSYIKYKKQREEQEQEVEIVVSVGQPVGMMVAIEEDLEEDMEMEVEVQELQGYGEEEEEEQGVQEGQEYGGLYGEQLGILITDNIDRYLQQCIYNHMCQQLQLTNLAISTSSLSPSNTTSTTSNNNSKILIHLLTQFITTSQNSQQQLQKMSKQHVHHIKTFQNNKDQEMRTKQQEILKIKGQGKLQVEQLRRRCQGVMKEERQEFERVIKGKMEDIKILQENVRRLQAHIKQEQIKNNERLQSTKQMYNKMINKLNKEIFEKQTKLEQYSNKISMLSNKIQKFQYQILEKNKIVEQCLEEVQWVGRESGKMVKDMEIKMERVLMEVWEEFSGVWRKIRLYEEIVEKQNQVIEVYNTCCFVSGKISQSNIDTPIKLIEQSTIQTQTQTQITTQIMKQFSLTQLQTPYKTIQKSVQSLLNSHRSQTISHQNLTHKYTQFLKQTEQKLQQYKTKLKNSQTQKQQYSNNNKQLLTENTNKTKQINSLLEMLRDNFQKERIGNQGKLEKISFLEKEVIRKDKEIQEFVRKNKEDLGRFQRERQMLRIQIQSLRQSISTLKNVIKFNQKQYSQTQTNNDNYDCNDLEKKIKPCIQKTLHPSSMTTDTSSIIQQMIDKTFQIRLENTKLKDKLSQTLSKYQQTSQNLSQCQLNLQLSHKKLQDTIISYNERFEQKQNQYKLLAQQLTISKQQTNKISNSLLQQSSRLKSQIEKLQQINKELINKLQEQKIQHSNNLQKIQKVYKTVILDDIKEKAVEGYIGNYQKLELYRLEIYVLGEIVAKYKLEQEKSKEKGKDIGLQADLREEQYVSVNQQYVKGYGNDQGDGNENDDEQNCINTIRCSKINVHNSNNSAAMGQNCSKRRQSRQSIGKLVQTNQNNKNNTNSYVNVNQNDNDNEKQQSSIQQLNKTCKLRINHKQSRSSMNLKQNHKEKTSKFASTLDQQKQNNPAATTLPPTLTTLPPPNKTQVQQLNTLINYMINSLKGYTRNGIRKNCWLTAQGQEYLTRVQSNNNIRQKYVNFQKVRSFGEKNQAIRNVVRDFQRILGYYFWWIQYYGNVNANGNGNGNGNVSSISCMSNIEENVRGSHFNYKSHKQHTFKEQGHSIAVSIGNWEQSQTQTQQRQRQKQKQIQRQRDKLRQTERQKQNNISYMQSTGNKSKYQQTKSKNKNNSKYVESVYYMRSSK